MPADGVRLGDTDHASINNCVRVGQSQLHQLFLAKLQQGVVGQSLEVVILEIEALKA